MLMAIMREVASCADDIATTACERKVENKC
jgi:hypothetical protein